jgi:hypothetical protein
MRPLQFLPCMGRAQNWRMAGPTPDIFCAVARNFFVSAQSYSLAGLGDAGVLR